MRPVRLFLAINLPAESRRALYAAMEPLRIAAPGVTWVNEERLHLTLKFFGERPDSDVPALSAAARAVADRHRATQLTLRGVGAFPNFRKPRVVWIGVSDNPRLELVQHDVERTFHELGYEIEGRVFRPHVTLARVRPAGPPEQAAAIAAAARLIDFHEDVAVPTLDLMQSIVGRDRPRYAVLHSAPLRSD